MNTVPKDLLCLVFGYLTVAEQVLSAWRVCRFWNQLRGTRPALKIEDVKRHREITLCSQNVTSLSCSFVVWAKLYPCISSAWCSQGLDTVNIHGTRTWCFLNLEHAALERAEVTLNCLHGVLQAGKLKALTLLNSVLRMYPCSANFSNSLRKLIVDESSSDLIIYRTQLDSDSDTSRQDFKLFPKLAALAWLTSELTAHNLVELSSLDSLTYLTCCVRDDQDDSHDEPWQNVKLRALKYCKLFSTSQNIVEQILGATTQLEVLNLQSCSLDDNIGRTLRGLTSLRVLALPETVTSALTPDLADLELDTLVFPCLTSVRPFRHVKDLSFGLSNDHLELDAVTNGHDLSASLTKLDIRRHRLSKKFLGELTTKRKLDSLQLQACEGLEKQCQFLLGLTRLRKLSLSDSSRLGNGSYCFGPEFAVLETINLSGTDVDSTSMRCLSQVPNLRVLILTACRDIDDHALRFLQGFDNLEVLDLLATRVRDHRLVGQYLAKSKSRFKMVELGVELWEPDDIHLLVQDQCPNLRGLLTDTARAERCDSVAVLVELMAKLSHSLGWTQAVEMDTEAAPDEVFLSIKRQGLPLLTESQILRHRRGNGP